MTRKAVLSGVAIVRPWLRRRLRRAARWLAPHPYRTPVLLIVLAIAGLGTIAPLIDQSKRFAGYRTSLGELTDPVPPTLGEVRAELDCLARNVYFEARGEPDEGKAAVAHVVMNRAASARFPDTVCEVVRQGGEERRHKCQFSWWCDGRSDLPTNQAAWLDSQDVAKKVFWGRSQDPTAGALWYHTDKVKPVWRKALVRGTKIGDHIFYLAPGERAQVASRAGDGAH